MEYLWNKITEGLKDLLISGITSNLSGLFDATNQKVGEIDGRSVSHPRLGKAVFIMWYATCPKRSLSQSPASFWPS